MRALHLALAAVLLLPAGCGSWNPLVAVGLKAQQGHKPTPLTQIKATVTPRMAWSAQVGKGGGFSFRPDTADGRVYAAAADGSISVIEEATGRVASRLETKKPLSGGVDIADGKIVAGTLKGEVVALDLSGKAVWTTSVAGEIISPPTVAGKTVLVRTADGRIFGLSAEDGKRRWVFQRPTPALLLRTSAGVMALGRDVVVGYPNGKLIALDVDDGKLIWEVNVSVPRGATELERIADVAGLPAVDGGTVCAAAYQGKVACFEIQSRNMLWSRDVSSSRSLVTDRRLLYLIDDTGAVHGLDRASGASVWKQDGLRYRKLASPVLFGGYLVVGDGFGFLHVLAPEDGSLVGRLATDGSAINWLVPTADGLAVQTEKGTVALLRF
jgi:outer membrane protein assembly factor BamB